MRDDYGSCFHGGSIKMNEKQINFLITHFTKNLRANKI